MFGAIFEDIILLSAIDLVTSGALFVFFANVLTIVLPNKSRYPAIQKILDLLNIFAMNIWRNANRIYPQRRNVRRRGKRGIDSGDDGSSVVDGGSRLGGGEP